MVGRTLRDNKNYDTALGHFETAFKMDPQLWLAKAGIAKIYREQGKLEESIEINQDVLKLAALENEKAGKDKDWNTVNIQTALAECYEEAANSIDLDSPTADVAKCIEYNQLALGQYKQAFKLNNIDYDNIDSQIGILHFFANPPAGGFHGQKRPRASGSRRSSTPTWHPTAYGLPGTDHGSLTRFG